MITCAYCGTGNDDNAKECSKCGAPRAHAFPQSLLTKAVNIYRELSTLPGTFPVQGYDASSWNGEQNGGITKSKVQFAFLRAGYGNATVDPRVEIFRRICRDFAIEYGLYWYCYVGLDWRKHAESFYNVWKLAPGKLPAVLDFESTTLDKASTAIWILNLIKDLEQRIGKKVMIYTSPGWWNGCVARNEWAHLQPLWNAHWTLAASPIVPWDWTITNSARQWEFWQHSADGNGLANEYGFFNGDPDLDLNRFNGSLDLFNSIYGTNILPIGSYTPPPLPDEVVPIYEAQVTASYLNIRSCPNALSKDLGDLRLGDILPVIEEKEGWCHVEGWISKGYIKEL